MREDVNEVSLVGKLPTNQPTNRSRVKEYIIFVIIAIRLVPGRGTQSNGILRECVCVYFTERTYYLAHSQAAIITSAREGRGEDGAFKARLVQRTS